VTSGTHLGCLCRQHHMAFSGAYCIQRHLLALKRTFHLLYRLIGRGCPHWGRGLCNERLTEGIARCGMEELEFDGHELVTAFIIEVVCL